jgi:ech hydrogenase subunit D
MQEEVIFVSSETLVGEAAKIKVEGFRLVTMSCVELDGDTVDILYHFDKDLTLKHLRLTASKDSAVPSISSVYFAAFLVENEIQDFFGIRFKGLVLDYERTLYLDSEVKIKPFCKYSVETSGQKKPVRGQSTAGP